MEKPPFQLRLKQALNQPVSKPLLFVAGAAVGLGGWIACEWGEHWAMSHWGMAIVFAIYGGISLLLGSKLNDRYELRHKNLPRSRRRPGNRYSVWIRRGS